MTSYDVIRLYYGIDRDRTISHAFPLKPQLNCSRHWFPRTARGGNQTSCPALGTNGRSKHREAALVSVYIITQYFIRTLPGAVIV